MSQKAKLKERFVIPADETSFELDSAGRRLHLTNLRKVFWPDSGLTKRELLQYYADVSAYLVPHLVDRAMVMKRYPDGIAGDHFFMKRIPPSAPEWINTCVIEHGSGSKIRFPVVADVLSLLWIVNLGCVDLNPWYARCDDVNRPDFLHFDLDPVPGAGFAKVTEAALIVREALAGLGMKPFAKTSGSEGIHLYVAIKRGPTQKQVWTLAKKIAQTLAGHYSKVLTAEYRIAQRPKGRVLVDYNQNAWGRTLASVYSVRPKRAASVSAPVTFEELEAGVRVEDFTMFNMGERLAASGDLWRPLLQARGRFDLEAML